MKFFQQQKYDEIGVLSVKLQKTLIFLAFVNLLGFFVPNALSWLCSIFSLTLIWIGFRGALHRNERAVRFYATVSLTVIVLSFVLVLFAIVFAANPNDNNEDSSEEEQVIYTALPLASDYDVPLEQTTASNNYNNNDGVVSSSLHQEETPVQNYPSVVAGNPEGNDLEGESEVAVPACLFVYMIFGMVVLAMKMMSIALACQISQRLRTAQARKLAHPLPDHNNNNNHHHTMIPMVHPARRVQHYTEQQQQQQTPMMMYYYAPFPAQSEYEHHQPMMMMVHPQPIYYPQQQHDTV